MSCYIDSGLTLGCRDASIGGIKSVYILGGSGNTISSITTDVKAFIEKSRPVPVR